MNQPVVDNLLENADSKYTVVVAVSRRARQINEGAEGFLDANSNKPVTVALQEFGAGLIQWYRDDEEDDS
jgi:DNA-directed RNA polymerase subunit omega